MSAAATVQGGVEIEIGGKVRRLVYNFNALAAFEKVTGKNALSGSALASLSATDFRALLWAGLLKHDPKLTQDQVGDWLDLASVSALQEKLGQAFTGALPEADDTRPPVADG